MLFLISVLLFKNIANGNDCYSTLVLESGQTAQRVTTPNYPFGDPPSFSCQWNLVSPEGTHIFLSCPNTNQVKVFPCAGYIQAATYHKGDVVASFCHDKGFSHHLVSNKMQLIYAKTPFSQIGAPFECFVSVVEDSKPSPGRGECNCGTRNTARIVGGEPTGVNEFPMMAGLVKLSNPTKAFCGATIISEFYALTAAHCVNKVTNLIGLLIGEHDRSRTDESNATKIITIEKIKFHEDYNRTGQRFNDIALVRVEEPIVFNQFVRPACLPFRNQGQAFEGETVTVLGWGRRGADRESSQKLRKVDLYVMKPDRCQIWFRDLANTQLCTFSAKKSTCKGDSGGPVLWLEPDTFQLKLIAVHSYGRKCSTNAPNIETRVTSFISWIELNAVGATFCRL